MRFLIEQAKSKSNIENQLYAIGDEIVYHLIKLFLFPDNKSKSHWIKELYAFLPRISKMKSTNSYPSSSFIYTYLFGDNEDTFLEQAESYIDEALIKDDLEITKSNINMIKLMQYIKNYCIWLSDKLSTKGFITLQEVKDYFN